MYDIAGSLTWFLPPKGSTTVISFTGASSSYTAVNADNAAKNYVFVSTQACHIVSGNSGVAAAATTDAYLPANCPMGFAVKPGEGVRVISDGTNGTLYIYPSGV